MYQSRQGADPGLSRMANNVRKDIGDIIGSGSYYVTNEIANELTNISNAIDHLHLDRSILSSTDSFNPRQTGNENNGKFGQH